MRIIKPEIFELIDESNYLTKNFYETLSIENIIYIEYGVPGAMGISGGVEIYYLENNNFYCAQSNNRENPDLYHLIEKDIFNKSFEYQRNTFRFLNVEKDPDDSNDFPYVRFALDMGNYCFFNRKVQYVLRFNEIIFQKNGIFFKFQPYCHAVFQGVIHEISHCIGLEINFD